jgi:hypothetical protein
VRLAALDVFSRDHHDDSVCQLRRLERGNDLVPVGAGHDGDRNALGRVQDRTDGPLSRVVALAR